MWGVETFGETTTFIFGVVETFIGFGATHELGMFKLFPSVDIDKIVRTM
jgi:hypothetical protein